MTAVVLGAIALAAVVLSFALVALTLTRALPAPAPPAPPTAPDPAAAPGDVPSTETMAQVLHQLEQLAALRERGTLTDEEFEAQKAHCLAVDRRAEHPALPHRSA